MKKLLLTLIVCLSFGLTSVATADISLPEGGGGGDTGTDPGAGAGTDPGTVVEVIDDVVVVITGDQCKPVCENDPDHCGVSIEDLLGETNFQETEPNDHWISSDPLLNGIPMSGQMYSTQDEDWFFVETTQPNTIIKLRMTASDGNWNISVRDSAGNTFAASDTIFESFIQGDAEDFDFEINEFVLDTTVGPADFYYVVVTPPLAEFDDTFSALYQLTAFIQPPVTTSPVQNVNFHDVETEDNDLFSGADRLSSDLTIAGQLMLPSDEDIFFIKSSGNEIVEIELCWENSGCEEQELNESWAAFAFDMTGVDDPNTEDNEADLLLRQLVAITDPNVENCPLPFPLTDHTYYQVYNSSIFEDHLVAVSDPTFGQDSRLEFGIGPLDEARVYYFAVTCVLERLGGSGAISAHSKSVTIIEDPGPQVTNTCPQFIVCDQFDDDNYSIRITRTALTPSVEEEVGAPRASLDDKGLLHLPEVEYAGKMYEADLGLAPTEDNPFTFELLDVREAGSD